MVNHFVTVCLALLPFAQCIQIHKHMTEEEVLKTFQTGHDNVPEYEVVRLYHTLHKRDTNDDTTRMVKLDAFGRELSFYLEPTKGLLAGVSTPVWTVVEDAGEPERTKYTEQTSILANIGQAYQGVSEMSAIVAYKGEDGETLVHGSLLEDIEIRPLPHRLRDSILRERKDLVDYFPDGVDYEGDFRRSHHHVVFKRRERDVNASHDGITASTCLRDEPRAGKVLPRQLPGPFLTLDEQCEKIEVTKAVYESPRSRRTRLHTPRLVRPSEQYSRHKPLCRCRGLFLWKRIALHKWLLRKQEGEARTLPYTLSTTANPIK